MYIINLLSLLFFYFQFLLNGYPAKALKFEYHNEKEMELFLKNFTKTTKNIHSEMYSIGHSSYRNTPLWVMKLSKNNNSGSEVPNIKYVANIHGNEAVGREILLHFMEYLRENYEKDNDVKCLLDNSNIHLLPCLNPDGFYVATEGHCDEILKRNNGERGNGEHLNRNFPGFYRGNLQPETEAVMKWMDDIPFILSAGLYGGNMVANFPLDALNLQKTSNNYSTPVTPDNDVFRNLASVYAENHPKMKKNRCEDDKPSALMFESGTTNSGSDNLFQGGMQNYNYKHGCMELALEISCCKYPKSSELLKLWNQNKKALLKYSLEALKGVAGKIVDSVTRKPIQNARLKIVDRNMTFRSTVQGMFWRILQPGKYQMEIEASGYYKSVENFMVKETKMTCPKPTKLEILLRPNSISKGTTKHHIIQRVKRSEFPRSKDGNTPTQSRVVNEPTYKWPIPPEEEKKIFMMLFGDPKEFKKNITERDIRDFMQNDLGINDTSKFNEILKNFDKKTEEEKNEIVLNLGKHLENVPESFTNVKILRQYIKRTLGIVDSAPYEDILKDFDKFNSTQKKIVLVKLAKKFHELSKNMAISYTKRRNSSANNLGSYLPIQLMIVVKLITYILCNYIHL